MGDVHRLPRLREAQPLNHDNQAPWRARSDLTLTDVARRLKLHAYRDMRTVIAHLRTLASHDHMPLPVNPRIFDGGVIRGARSICRSSLWDAGEFDAWLESRRTPSPALMAVADQGLRADLATRAAHLSGAA